LFITTCIEKHCTRPLMQNDCSFEVVMLSQLKILVPLRPF